MGLLPTLRALGGCLEKHTGMSKCISGVSDSAFSLLKREKKKGDKGAIRRLFINITGISQRSTEMVEAGWAYQKLYEIVGFDQHLITLRLLGSVSLTLSRRRQGGAGASLVPLLPLHVSVRWVDGT